MNTQTLRPCRPDGTPILDGDIFLETLWEKKNGKRIDHALEQSLKKQNSAMHWLIDTAILAFIALLINVKEDNSAFVAAGIICSITLGLSIIAAVQSWRAKQPYRQLISDVKNLIRVFNSFEIAWSPIDSVNWGSESFYHWTRFQKKSDTLPKLDERLILEAGKLLLIQKVMGREPYNFNTVADQLEEVTAPFGIEKPVVWAHYFKAAKEAMEKCLAKPS